MARNRSGGLAVDVRGEGTSVVLIHGLTFSRRTWAPITELLAEHHRVVAVDLPGHGESDGSAADPRVVVERLHMTLTEIDVDQPVVVGHSAGGLLATGYGAAHPTAGVVNVDQPVLVAPFATFVQQLAERLRGPSFAEAFAPFEQSIGVEELPEPERSRVMDTRYISQDVVLDHWHAVLTTSPAELQATVDEMLDRISVPYLYLAGHELPEPVVEHLRTHVPQAEVVVWPDGGHLVHHTEPHRFAQLVSEFASRVIAT